MIILEAVESAIREQGIECSGVSFAPSASSEHCTLWFEASATREQIASAYAIANQMLEPSAVLAWEKEQAKKEADELAIQRIIREQAKEKLATDESRNAAIAEIDKATTREQIEVAKKLAERTTKAEVNIGR